MSTISQAISPAALQSSRDDYSEAMAAIRSGAETRYDQLRSALDSYPLAIYLDYYKLSGQPRRVQAAQARRFIDLSRDTPLPNRFLSVYLHRAGKDRRWQDFLSVMPSEPNNIELKCYYFRAKLSAGDKISAWEGAQRLWVHGESQPKVCDPLFSAWLKAGQLSDEVVWARLLATFDARERSLMTYVAGKGSSALTPWSDKLLAVYHRPDHMRRQSLPASSPYSSDIVSYGVAFLARYNPENALRYWLDYQTKMSFSAAQIQRAEYAIALRSLFAKTDAHVPWLEGALARQKNDMLVEIRLRWILGEQDWATLERTLPLLSDARVQANVWRYWHAISLERLGQTELARQSLSAVAQERDYYGFLAADKLGRPYAFNQQVVPGSVASIGDLPRVLRIEELIFHGESGAAHSEWLKGLQSSDPSAQISMGTYAAQQGWHRMAIDAANNAKAWDRLDLRFPMPYQTNFERYANVQNVPKTELMAIARRESAFYPQVRSPVGARGLMQLMPATAKQVASGLGVSHRNSDLFEVDHNIRLGSAYYRELLDRYSGNRILALSAYNAGPHRVDRWRHKAGESVPVEIWVETIPFRETRNYVQAVLSYNTVFNHLLGVDLNLLTSAELQAAY